MKEAVPERNIPSGESALVWVSLVGGIVLAISLKLCGPPNYGYVNGAKTGYKVEDSGPRLDHENSRNQKIFTKKYHLNFTSQCFLRVYELDISTATTGNIKD